MLASAAGAGVSAASTAAFFLETGYGPELEQLQSEMGNIDEKLLGLEGDNRRLSFVSATAHAAGAAASLDAARAELEHAQGGRRQQMEDLGLSIDHARMKDSDRAGEEIGDAKTEASRPDGAARATSLLSAAQAVEELVMYLNEFDQQASAMQSGGKLKRALIAGKATVPTRDPDTGEMHWDEGSEGARQLGAAMELHDELRQAAKIAQARMGPIGKGWNGLSLAIINNKSS